MDEFEIKIVKYFNQIGGKKFDDFLALINSIRFLVFFWATLALLAIVRNPEILEPFASAIIIVTILHFTITEGIIKHLLTRCTAKRKRPYIAYPELIRSIGRKFSDASFPSSHMATTASMLVVIVAFYPSLIFLSVGMIIIMAFSRLHNGMHYPSDIIAGLIFGLLYGWAAMEIVNKYLM